MTRVNQYHDDATSRRKASVVRAEEADRKQNCQLMVQEVAIGMASKKLKTDDVEGH